MAAISFVMSRPEVDDGVDSHPVKRVVSIGPGLGAAVEHIRDPVQVWESRPDGVPQTIKAAVNSARARWVGWSRMLTIDRI
jgi:hypothetical protein